MCAFLSYVTASNYFGFGVMDAKKMVEFAKVWHTVPDQKECREESPLLNRLVTCWHSFNIYWSLVGHVLLTVSTHIGRRWTHTSQRFVGIMQIVYF